MPRTPVKVEPSFATLSILGPERSDLSSCESLGYSSTAKIRVSQNPLMARRCHTMLHIHGVAYPSLTLNPGV